MHSVSISLKSIFLFHLTVNAVEIFFGIHQISSDLYKLMNSEVRIRLSAKSKLPVRGILHANCPGQNVSVKSCFVNLQMFH